MDFKVVAAVCALVLSVVSTCSCANPPEEYLGIGTDLKSKELRWISKRIDSGDWGQDVSTLASKLIQATEVALDASRNGIKGNDKFGISTYKGEKLSDLYWALSNLLAFSHDESNLAKCNNQQAKVFVELVDLQFGGLKKFQKHLESPAKSLFSSLSSGLLFEYLKTYGLKHIEECLASLPERFEEKVKELPAGIEAELDTLMTLGERYLHKASDAQLASWAEIIDLAKGKFDAARMLVSVRQLIDGDEMKPLLMDDKPGKLLGWFIWKTCYLYRTHYIPVDMYNLARLLVPEAASNLQMSDRFNKLNEYSRLCIPFYNYHTRDKAQSNVAKNMPRNAVLG